MWPNHEAASAFARSLKDKEYILPVRFDDHGDSGLLPTIGYVNAELKSPNSLAFMIEEKTFSSKRQVIFPTQSHFFKGLFWKTGADVRRG